MLHHTCPIDDVLLMMCYSEVSVMCVFHQGVSRGECSGRGGTWGRLWVWSCPPLHPSQPWVTPTTPPAPTTTRPCWCSSDKWVSVPSITRLLWVTVLIQIYFNELFLISIHYPFLSVWWRMLMIKLVFVDHLSGGKCEETVIGESLCVKIINLWTFFV